MVKKCEALRDKRICGKEFEDVEGFLTCPQCRVYLPTHNLSGGCNRWSGVFDPKVTKQHDEVAYTERAV